MKKLSFSIFVNAGSDDVCTYMLGLTDKSTYEQWTSVFNPTSTFEGSWDKGSKMYFTGTDENGKRGGMISRIDEHIPDRFVSIVHFGILDGDIEILDGPQVDQWAGGREEYRFEQQENNTLLTVTIDVNEDHISYFNETYPAALNKLKTLIELP
mgnify:CR=1 FL=1